MRNENPLAQNFRFFSLLRFTLPSIAMMLFMGLYTITDTIFVSRFVNTDALSAINIVCPIINLIVGLSTMIAAGGSAVVARKMGADDPQRAKQDFTLIVIFGVLLGVLILCLGLLWIDELIWGLGASQKLFPYCKAYLSTLLLFTPASILQVLFQNLIITAGKPAFGLTLSLGAGLLNLLFDYIFMACFDFGIIGAALGTGIGYLMPALFGIWFFSKSRSSLSFIKPIADGAVLLESCSNGVSEMVSQLSMAVTTFFFNFTMMKLLGEQGVAAITILIYSQFLLTALYIGFAMGAAPIISYNYGAGNVWQLKKVYRSCVCFIAVSSLIVFLCAFWQGESLVLLFTGNERTVYEITVQGFAIFAFSFLFSGFNIFASAFFTALSNGRVSALISFLRTFVLVMGALLILPAYLGITGVWLAVPLAESFTFVLSLLLMVRCKDQYGYL